MVELEPLLRWAAAAIGPTAKVVAHQGLREGSNPWLLRIDNDSQLTEAVLKLGSKQDPEDFITEVAALRLAGTHGLPAPSVLACDLEGTEVGAPVLLETVVPGSSKIPVEATPEYLRATGAAIAPLRTVYAHASTELPLRTRPISASDFAASRRDGSDQSTRHLDDADRRVRQLPMPGGRTTLVHGDLWQGNLLWSNGELTGIIDWDMAGVGHYGIDLCALRLDAVLLFGVRADALVLEGWQRATGERAEALPYWDVVAALNMPTDMSVSSHVSRCEREGSMGRRGAAPSAGRLRPGAG